jgi:glycosyltransferase involved in cell wall biosynthesis
VKVLHVIPSLSAYHGGATAAVALMERALTDEGVTVECAATDDNGPGQRNGKVCGCPVRENGAVRWYFPKRLEFYKVSPAFAQWIVSEVGRYDLLHLHALFSFTTSAAALAARRARVPYIVDPLGSLNEYGITQRRRRLKLLSMRWVEAPILRNAAAIHFNSPDEARQAAALGIAWHAAIIPLGVDIPRTTVGARPPASGGSYLLYLSRLDPKKNLEALLEAVALLTAEFPDLKLVVAGDGLPEYVAALKHHARILGINDRVTWTGHIDGQAKAEAFANATAFVLPSHSENFGIAAAEALAAGLPCLLGTGVAIAGAVVDAGAGLAVAPQAQSIAAGLRRLLGDTDTLRAMSKNARQLAQDQFSVPAMGKRLKQLYEVVLAR